MNVDKSSFKILKIGKYFFKIILLMCFKMVPIRHDTSNKHVTFCIYQCQKLKLPCDFREQFDSLSKSIMRLPLKLFSLIQQKGIQSNYLNLPLYPVWITKSSGFHRFGGLSPNRSNLMVNSKLDNEVSLQWCGIDMNHIKFHTLIWYMSCYSV